MQLQVRSADRVILAYGTALGEPAAGVTLEDVEDQATVGRIVSALNGPNGGVTISPDHATVATMPVPAPDPTIAAAQQQRLNDAVTMLNSAAVMADQTTRDAFARQIGIQPLTIPITQKAVATDIKPLAGP